MALVITSSIPTETLYDISTITSESTSRSRARVTTVTTITSEDVELDEDGDLVPITTTFESEVVSTSTSRSTRTYTSITSIPVETLYSISLSTSTVDDDDDDETTSTTASLSLIRGPLQPTLSATSSSSSADDVVVVTQFTTITPSIATTSTDLPTLASSSSTSRNAVFPGGSSSSRAAPNAGADNAASSTSSSVTSLSSGAIAGIAIGAVAVAILLGILGFLFCCRQKRKSKRDSMYATTGGQSDEKLATALFSNPDYSRHRQTGQRYTDDSPPRRMPSSTSKINARGGSSGGGQRQLMMASVGGAGLSSIGAGAAGIGAAGNYDKNYGNSNGTSNGRRISSANPAAAAPSYQTGKNKPVPDVPPPVSNLFYSRSPPPQGSAGYTDYGTAAAAAAGMMGRPSTASPNLATQAARNGPGGTSNNRTSAPVFMMNNNNNNSASVPTPVQTPQERAEALKRAKSVASIKSIPPEKLGKGAGYASPMPPLDPLGKPLDQKTWRERQSKVKSGINFSPDTVLTPEQKMRRDSQIAKLNAARDGTASSKPGLSNLQERDEPVETSPLLHQGDDSFEGMMSSPEKASTMLPVRPTTSRNSLPSESSRQPQERNYNRDSSDTILPYAAPQGVRPPRASSFSAPKTTSQPQNYQQPQPPPRSPPPNNPSSAIYPSLPPNSPSRSAALSQSTQAPASQPRYELHQPLAQSYNPIRASFASAPLSSSTTGPPPTQSNGNRLPAIPGSRPTSIATTLPEYRRSLVASYTNNTPYAAAANASQATSSPNPFFQHHNGSGNSFGQSSNRGIVPSTSIAENIYGGLTQGLSDRDLARLSQSQQAGSGRK